MTEPLTAEETVAAIAMLTRDRLEAYVEIGIVMPLQAGDGPRFSAIDRARLELVCELAETHELADEALALVMSLVDQLHAARADLQALGRAVDVQPDEVRESVLSAWRAARGGLAD
ncbi:hypothetical protein [Maricaulis sp.]|uniref:hypothetical protein n=1 Tax=Maricaulis sp. TaxID=1486257 RepID=UPI003A8E63E4